MPMGRSKIIIQKICPECGKHFLDDTTRHSKICCSRKCCRKRYRRQNREKIKHQQKVRDMRRRERLRKLVLEHYGGNPPKCACCGETEIRFLTVDHIDPTYKPDSKGKRKRGANYSWIVKNNFPEGFQILCFNCNCGRHHNGGVCPHKDKGSLKS